MRVGKNPATSSCLVHDAPPHACIFGGEHSTTQETCFVQAGANLKMHLRLCCRVSQSLAVRQPVRLTAEDSALRSKADMRPPPVRRQQDRSRDWMCSVATSVFSRGWGGGVVA